MSKRLLFVLIRPILLFFSLLAICVPLLGTGTAFASKTPHVACCASGYYYVTNKSYGGESDQLEYRVAVGPGRTVNITESWQASNSWGANVGVTADVVTAGLNFNVTASYGVSYTCGETNTSNQTDILGWWSVYNIWNYSVYYHQNGGGNIYEGTGWAYQYIYPLCY